MTPLKIDDSETKDVELRSRDQEASIYELVPKKKIAALALPKSDKEEELITYEEALERAGGLGIYQILICVATCFLTNYSYQMVVPFGYLTNAPSFYCRASPEDEWAICTREEICADESTLEYKFNTEDPQFVNGLFTEMDMTCWSSEKINSLISIYFVGWGISSLFVWIPEKFGRVATIKVLSIPLAVVLYTSFLIFNDYGSRWFIYLLLGISKMKTNLTLITALEHLPAKNRALGQAFNLGYDSMTWG